MERKEQSKIFEEDNLQEIKISDYFNLSEDIKEWIVNEQELPEYFWDKLKNTEEVINLKALFNKIKKELFVLYGNKRDKAESFADSRFIPLSEMIERGMVSCGAMTNIFGTVLRKFGIPVRFIHGRIESRISKRGRHAWLEIYNPLENKWFEADPTRQDFKVCSDIKRYKIYHDWAELKKDYDEGNF